MAGRSYTTAWLLWAFFGWMGAHRFYVGHPATGLAYLLTVGMCCVGWLCDAFSLVALVDDANARDVLQPLLETDSDGRRLTYSRPPPVVFASPPGMRGGRDDLDDGSGGGGGGGGGHAKVLPPAVIPVMVSEV